MKIFLFFIFTGRYFSLICYGIFMDFSAIRKGIKHQRNSSIESRSKVQTNKKKPIPNYQNALSFKIFVDNFQEIFFIIFDVTFDLSRPSLVICQKL